MTTYTFTVDNDQGKLVKKTESKSWVKQKIKQDLERAGLRTTFRVRQTGDNSVEAYNTKGNTITYHYGGFDGYEVLEPSDHSNWPEKPRESTRWGRYLNTVGIEQGIKLTITLENQLFDVTQKYKKDIILKGLTRGIRKEKNHHTREFYIELRRRVKEMYKEETV